MNSLYIENEGMSVSYDAKAEMLAIEILDSKKKRTIKSVLLSDDTLIHSVEIELDILALLAKLRKVKSPAEYEALLTSTTLKDLIKSR